MFEQCGTPAYIAPELIRDKKGYTGTACDLWSAGCCLYAMLVGNVPFRASTMNELHKMIIEADYSFDESK
jgi:serine/threonine protein kinase